LVLLLQGSFSWLAVVLSSPIPRGRFRCGSGFGSPVPAFVSAPRPGRSSPWSVPPLGAVLVPSLWYIPVFARVSAVHFILSSVLVSSFLPSAVRATPLLLVSALLCSPVRLLVRRAVPCRAFIRVSYSASSGPSFLACCWYGVKYKVWLVVCRGISHTQHTT
jgi:hypothetical protein